LAFLVVKSIWQKFFSSALFVVDFVGSQNRRIFFGKGFGKSSLQLVSKSLSQFCFGWSRFLIFGVFVSHAFCQLPKIKLCVKISVSWRWCLFSASVSSSSTAPNKACT